MQPTKTLEDLLVTLAWTKNPVAGPAALDGVRRQAADLIARMSPEEIVTTRQRLEPDLRRRLDAIVAARKGRE